MARKMTKKEARESGFDLQSVGGLARYLLLTTDKSYYEIQNDVRKACDSRTSRATIRWYATSLRNEGYELPNRPRSEAV